MLGALWWQFTQNRGSEWFKGKEFVLFFLLVCFCLTVALCFVFLKRQMGLVSDRADSTRFLLSSRREKRQLKFRA